MCLVNMFFIIFLKLSLESISHQCVLWDLNKNAFLMIAGRQSGKDGEIGREIRP